MEWLNKESKKYKYKKVVYKGTEYVIKEVFWSIENEELVFYIENFHYFKRVYKKDIELIH